MKNNTFDIYTAEYENWFKENNNLFQSELLALKRVVPTDKKGIEIGKKEKLTFLRFLVENLNMLFGQ